MSTPANGITLEPAAGDLALRLGLRQIKVKQDDAEILIACRGGATATRATCGGAVACPGTPWKHWRAAAQQARPRPAAGVWAVRGLAQAITGPAEARAGALPLFAAAEARDGQAVAQREAAVALPATPLGEDVVDDYAALRLLKAHPVSLLRADLAASGRVTTADLSVVPTANRCISPAWCWCASGRAPPRG